MRRTPVVLVSLLFYGFFFSACHRSSEIENRCPEDVKLAKTYFEMLRAGKYDDVEKTVDPAVMDDDFRAAFDALAGTIPAENPVSSRTTVAEKQCSGDVCIAQTVVEYTYANELLLFKVSFRHTGSTISTTGMHVRTIPESQITANEFRLKHKGLGQYAMLLLAIVFPVLTLYALVLCIRSNVGHWKWLWVPFILFGLCKLDINWTTGEFNFWFAAIQLFSADAFSESYGPWMISISFPIGAILFVTTHRISKATRSKPRVQALQKQKANRSQNL